VVLEATHASTLQYVKLEILQLHAWHKTADGSAAS
jgi:hypothetical protein